MNEDELDHQLEELAQLAQSHPKRSPKRAQALDRLIRKIQASQRLGKPYRDRFHDRYSTIYQEGLQILWQRICREIDRYDPTKGTVMAWVNNRFGYCILDASKEIIGGKDLPRVDLDDFETYVSNQTPEEPGASISDLVDACIEEDAQGVFQHHVRNYPQATFQMIHRLEREGRSWQEIADQTGVTSIQTLSSFWQRCLKRFTPQIVVYVQEYGQFSQRELKLWRDLGL